MLFGNGPPPQTPPPQTEVIIVGKNEIYHWEPLATTGNQICHLVGPFLVHKSPPPHHTHNTPILIHACPDHQPVALHDPPSALRAASCVTTSLPCETLCASALRDDRAALHDRPSALD